LYDLATVEALKILVRSYLSDLQRHNINTSGKKLQSSEREEPKRRLNTIKTGSSWENHSDAKVNNFSCFCSSLIFHVYLLGVKVKNACCCTSSPRMYSCFVA
jgi:hypothetical protein